MESMNLDVEKLESDVRQMADKISDYRQSLPIHLRNTLHSALSDHIPNIYSGSDPPPSSSLTVTEPQVPVVFGTSDQESLEKMIQLKEIMSRNAATIPKVVKRVRESIDKIDSLNGTIHPAFTRRTIN